MTDEMYHPSPTMELLERMATLEAEVRAMREAVALAARALEVRLEGMNEVRAQLNRAEDRYLTKDEYTRAHGALVERIASMRSQMAVASFVAAALMTAFFEWFVRRGGP